jgi:hypothetical protein
MPLAGSNAMTSKESDSSAPALGVVAFDLIEEVMRYAMTFGLRRVLSGVICFLGEVADGEARRDVAKENCEHVLGLTNGLSHALHSWTFKRGLATHPSFLTKGVI